MFPVVLGIVDDLAIAESTIAFKPFENSIARCVIVLQPVLGKTTRMIAAMAIYRRFYKLK